MESGSQRYGSVPDPTEKPRGADADSGAGATVSPMDADADLEGFAAHLYNDPAAMAPPRATPKRKERSAQSKKKKKL